MDLENKVALVTGAGVRLGQAVALKLGQLGMRLVIHYHHSEKGAKQTIQNLPGKESRHLLLQADLKDISAIIELVKQAEEQLGPVSVLVNNAAEFFPTPLFSATEEEWDHILTLNLKAPFFLSQAVGEGMKSRGEGKIINMVDVSTDRPWTSFLPYCSSKAGLVSLTKGLARALSPEVQVNGIAPGTVLAPPDHADLDLTTSVENSLLKRIGKAEDIVQAVEYLLQSDFVTGTILPVDGGRSVY
ncbi:MAG: Enoyl-[acyl-carrier-protein] reductase [NADPH] FabL [Deltaproteobacteria bacterium]|jgi:NAD(P)-dependent dehydrogenase (short-subunit alcohol dehydrogenase family)|nr:Enoyl-[acyl-carrier-protein] reductase [NADPH] FabL [Deltaproteobacteria bacterium]